MIRLAMVGAGAIAGRHMEAFERIGDVKPLWVVTRTAEQAAGFAKRWHYEREGTDLQSVLKAPDIDVMVIASPNREHASQAAAALEAGKHVILEIPAALSFADAQNLAMLSERHRRRLFVCHTLRSFAAIRYIRESALSGLSVSSVVGYFAIPRLRNQSPNGTRSWVDDLLWHHGCHFVDAALWTLGADRADIVSTICGNAHPIYGMVMDLSLAFRTPAGQIVTLALTYNTEHPVAELRYFAGDSQLIYRDGSLSCADGRVVVPGSQELDLAPQNRAMLLALESGEASDYDIASILPSMRILQNADTCSSRPAGSDSPKPPSGIREDAL